ncbi:MAG: Asp-tRNA(Asn)/Glu-tRNA(Gln) amidotransferase subunit GatB [Candidatus Omnitrophota bacterium]
MEFETVIGLEVHVHLLTKSKAFCGCSTDFGNNPNSQTCPVCLGLPGSLPVLNKRALELAIKTALTLHCKISGYIKFDRKNYFYPDLPKNFQISQYDLPLSSKGYLDIEIEGKPKRIGITRVHLEEDAGKLIHKEDYSLVDYNRSGIPLLEIVSEPDINSPFEAYEYLAGLKAILEYLEVSDCDMEKGSLRCDANISIREPGQKSLGKKTELKNMNSFKAVKAALEFEAHRQAKILEEGGKLVQETRLWDDESETTFCMRSKEEAHDYRYFPEPDLPYFSVDERKIDSLKKEIPELPKQKVGRFIKEYGLSDYDANTLAGDKAMADYFEACLKHLNRPKEIANWIIGPVSSQLNSRKLNIKNLNLRAQTLVKIIGLVSDGQISNLRAKDLLTEVIDTGGDPETIMQEKEMLQLSDKESLENFVNTAIEKNPGPAKEYLGGKDNALSFLVGQALKASGGKANPKIIKQMLEGKLLRNQ